MAAIPDRNPAICQPDNEQALIAAPPVEKRKAAANSSSRFIVFDELASEAKLQRNPSAAAITMVKQHMRQHFLSLVFLAVAPLPASPANVVFGRRVYAANGRTYQQIWRLDTATRKTVPLTSGARRHVQPSCSPDAQRIWFLSGGFGDELNTELWWFDPRTKEEKLALTFKSGISRLLGGSGTQAFFTAYDGQETNLYSWNGSLKKLIAIDASSDNPAALSPDTRTLAVQTEPDSVTMVDATGAHGRKVAHCAAPVWSPDGRMLACAAGRVIRLVNLTTGIEESRTEFLERSTPPSVAAISPGSKELLVKTVGASSNSTSPQSDYWTLDVAHAKWTFMGPGQSGILAPGLGVLLITPRDLASVGSRRDWVSQMLAVDPVTHAQTPIAEGTASNVEPSLCSLNVPVSSHTNAPRKKHSPRRR
jgi:Tol biopolymer transport system component